MDYNFLIGFVRRSLIAISWSSFTGLMADQSGNYVYSFYMTGAALLTAFLIPMVLIVVNFRKSRVHPQTFEEADNERSNDGV